MLPTINKIAGVASHLWAKIFVPVGAEGSSTVGCAVLLCKGDWKPQRKVCYLASTPRNYFATRTPLPTLDLSRLQ